MKWSVIDSASLPIPAPHLIAKSHHFKEQPRLIRYSSVYSNLCTCYVYLKFIPLHIRKINTHLLRLGPFLPQNRLPLRASRFNRYNQSPPKTKPNKQKPQHNKQTEPKRKHLWVFRVRTTLKWPRIPGTNPSVQKSTGIISPFSSLACSTLNPHN